VLVDRRTVRQAQIADHDHGGHGNEHAIDGEEVDGPAKEGPVAIGQTIARRTQGRHQGCRDGDTRDDIAFLATGDADDARQPAEQCDQDVPDGGCCSRQQFRMRLCQGRHPKIER